MFFSRKFMTNQVVAYPRVLFVHFGMIFGEREREREREK
jgi:hypothetical protein